MAWVAVATAAITVGGSYLSSRSASKSANQAAGVQSDAAMAGIAQQDKQFEAIQKLLEPYVNAGNGALAGQQDLIGLNGQAKQAGAISGLENSPQFAALMGQGENAILQNASATGGLRGGNTQGALAQFRPQLLTQLIDQQYQRLGGLTSVGQNAAAGVGNAGMQTGNNITDLLQQKGAAQAGAFLANGRADQQMINGVTQALGTFIGKF